MNETVAILTLLIVMAIICWLYFRITDHHDIHIKTN